MPPYFVERPRLSDVLETVASRPLTLVIAPAGSGKTQLLSSWAAGTTVPIAWLSLEELDDDPAALWAGVTAALEPLAPEHGATARSLIIGGAPADAVVRSLLNDFDEVEADDAVLVLDDIHHIADPEAAGSLSLFVQHLPGWLHVVIAGRADPSIPLDRLRGQGQVAELRFADLRFTSAETRDVLSRLAPELSDDEIEASTEQTDGWAAGVQLAALAARAARTQGIVDDRRVSRQLTEDYVRHEVLATGDPTVVDLLMRVSVVDRVNGALACAIAQRDDAYELLLAGEAQGMFVHRLGADGWFRIHPLVREGLYSELVRRSWHLEHHERAARWLEDSGETVTALNQWLLAERPREALRLLAARSTALYDDGREAVIARTLEAVPREVAVTDVSAMVDWAVSHILGPLPAFRTTVREAAWHAERDGSGQAGTVSALQAVAEVMSGSWHLAAEHGNRAIAELGADWWTDPAGRFAWNTQARAVALSEAWDDDEPFVRDATMAMSRDARRGLSLEGIRALGHAMAGRPVDALRVGAGIRSAAESMSILRVELALAEGLARFELGDHERAVEILRPLADDEGEPRLFAPVASRLALAKDAQADGELDTAAAELQRAESLVASLDAGPDLRAWVRRIGVDVALARGELDEARRLSAAVADGFWGPVCDAKIALAAGDPVAASAALGDAAPRSVRQVVVHGLLSARSASATDEVLAHVAPALEVAARHGMLRTVVSEGAHLADAIERSAWRVPEEWLQRLRRSMAPAKVDLRGPLPGTPEVLTAREQDVLRLLPSRLTLGEIAGELYVSVNTIKFHLRIIYRKLGVNSREEAAAIARSRMQMAPTGDGF